MRLPDSPSPNSLRFMILPSSLEFFIVQPTDHLYSELLQVFAKNANSWPHENPWESLVEIMACSSLPVPEETHSPTESKALEYESHLSWESASA